MDVKFATTNPKSLSQLTTGFSDEISVNDENSNSDDAETILYEKYSETKAQMSYVGQWAKILHLTSVIFKIFLTEVKNLRKNK